MTKRTLISLSCAIAVSACADHAARDTLAIQDRTVLKTGFGATQDTAAGAPTQAWLDKYGEPLGDDAIADAQGRLDALKAAHPERGYFSAKAQCWIDAVTTERDQRSQWGFVPEALGEANRIVDSMQKGNMPDVRNAQLRTSVEVRPDLWASVRNLQRDPAFLHCLPAQATLACSEVALIHAGYEAWTRDFIAAKARVDGVETGLQRASGELDACRAQAAPVAAPVAASPAPAGVPKHLRFKTDGLFRFGSADLLKASSAGMRELAQLVTALRDEQASVIRIDIDGHTDRIGRDADNDALSARRAQRVKAYLLEQGVNVPIATRGRGKREPVVDCAQKNRAALIACLAPNRRVDVRIEVKGE
ncbi:OmpA family protein [Trinickia mobilis]|uniref:OmpA family protein n=1 Tax=Trinickia mobilis TaxID=2816356 RepID=UPI001A905C05|nr:OmpA family protein [Trinickia mobilis]